MKKNLIFLLSNVMGSILFTVVLAVYSTHISFGQISPIIFFCIHFIFITATFPLYVIRLKIDKRVLTYKDYLVYPFFIISLLPMLLACHYYAQLSQVDSTSRALSFVLLGCGATALILILLSKFVEVRKD